MYRPLDNVVAHRVVASHASSVPATTPLRRPGSRTRWRTATGSALSGGSERVPTVTQPTRQGSVVAVSPPEPVTT